METDLTSQQRAALRRSCHTILPGHRQLSPAEEFAALAGWCSAHAASADVYGEGGLTAAFEQKLAALLGKEAAVFMPSGKMAQLIALKIYTEQARIARFGMHATAHLELHEARAYAALLGLHGVLVGSPTMPILASDLAAITEPIGCLVLELPMRECGGLLPTWEQLTALAAAARTRAVPLHMDGARLWECGPYFAPRSYADVAALFDSVYVSCYKGIGGMSGAVLAGTAGFIASARTWQIRFGGQLPQQTAIVASAAMRFDAQLAAMPRYVARAQTLAQALRSLEMTAIAPAQPVVNMMHLHVRRSAEAMARARDAHAAAAGVWAFGMPRATGAGGCVIELTVGENLLAVGDDAVLATLGAIVADAGR